VPRGKGEEKPTVASNDQELVFVSMGMDVDVGVGRNDLVLRIEVGALLELKVSESS
jgi:hypothetical protein